MRWYCAICWRMRKAMKGSINGTIISSNRYPCALSGINFKKSVVSSRAEERIQCAYQVTQCSLDSRVCGGENCNPTD